MASGWKKYLDGTILPVPSASNALKFPRQNSTGTVYELKSITEISDEINNKIQVSTPSSAANALTIDLDDFDVEGNLVGFYIEILLTIFARHNEDKDYNYIINAHRKLIFNVVYDNSGVPNTYPVTPAAGDFVTENGGVWYNLADETSGAVPLAEIPVQVKNVSNVLCIGVGNALGTASSGINSSITIPLYFTYEVKIIKNAYAETT